MATTHRRNTATRRNQGSDLREDVREAVERAWPGGVVEMAFDADESWFQDVYSKLASAIRRIKGAQLAHEREPESEPVWFDSDHEEYPPLDFEPSRSYHLFFVCPEGEAFQYETEIESIGEPDWYADEDDRDEDESELPMETVAGSGRTGWAVAVSLVAPFAVITLSDMETYEDGSFSEPTIESQGFTETFQRIDPEAAFLKSKGERAFQKLLKLRGRICNILDKLGIGVLPEAEWRKPVPGLRADSGVFAGAAGEPLRVLDALFFEGL
jgi:hypothetical protein